MSETLDATADLTWVTSDLATGGDLSYNKRIAWGQVQDILAQGVGQIIDMRAEADDTDLWRKRVPDGPAYMWLPTDDAYGHHIPAELFDAAVLEARRCYRFGTKTFVHCHMGINRGPSVTYAILLDRGWDCVEAFDLIRQKRPQAAIAYAEDALKAHHHRLARERRVERGTVSSLIRLRDHIDSIWTVQERSRIARLIRQTHAVREAERAYR